MQDLDKFLEVALESRFNTKFYVTPGCWIWTGSRHGDGYGHFKLNGKVVKAHTLAYQLYVGEYPKHLIVRHKCDNPSCVNPEHLELGTHADNAADRNSRKRTAIGEQNGKTRITDEQVRWAKQQLSQGVSRATVAFKLGVSGRTVWYSIKTRQLD